MASTCTPIRTFVPSPNAYVIFFHNFSFVSLIVMVMFHFCFSLILERSETNFPYGEATMRGFRKKVLTCTQSPHQRLSPRRLALCSINSFVIAAPRGWVCARACTRT